MERQESAGVAWRAWIKERIMQKVVEKQYQH